jgi:pyruvate,water dikinase
MASATVESPVRWDDPADGGSTLFPDLMHFPHPLSPLTQTALFPPFEAGFSAAADEYGAPMRAIRCHFRNHYWFGKPEFVAPTAGVEGRAGAVETEDVMTTEAGRLMERWREEHLPRVRAHLDRLAAMDIYGASTAELAALFDEVDDIQRDLWAVHFRIVGPMTLAMQLFDELYVDLFGGDEADAHALIVGLPSESIRAAIGLSDLAAAAREAGLAALILETTDAELTAQLQAGEPGREFLLRLDRYLDAYGLRQDLFDFATPTWREDPTIALAAVRSYLRSGYDAQAAHEEIARRADAAIAAARERLAVYPAAVRERFEALLATARAAHFLQEEHNFYLDQQGLASVRLVFVRVGGRLVAADALDAADDVFMLTLDEVKAATTNERASPLDLRAIVGERRAELAWAWTLTPPPFIGEPPAAPPPSDNPMALGNDRFWGAPPPPGAAPNELRGNAGSRGTATGMARVARTLAEATTLQPGEVLVAITTMPPWTPLFGVAAAVVTETGGPLSHCAIVAREYGIPAVVGARGATSAIRTGQVVTVDGGRGVVILGEAEGA